MLIRSDSASRDALYDWITIIRYTAQFSSSSSSSSPSSSSSSSSSSSTSFSPSLNSSTIHCTSYSLSCYFPPMILLILLGRPNCNRNSKGPAGRRPRHPIIASFIATFTEFLHNFPHFPPPLRSFFFFDWPRFSSDPASVISSQWCYSQNCHYYLKNVRLNINHDDCDEECCNETFKGSTYPYHFFFR